MAHFAEVDDGIVLRVLSVDNYVTTVDGVEDEQRGIDFLNDLYPDSGTWVQTSVNATIRGRYAGLGWVYDQDNDVFYPQQPFPSWTLDSDWIWTSPVAPTQRGYTVWNEDLGQWDRPLSPYPSWAWTEDEDKNVSSWKAPVAHPVEDGADPADGPWAWNETDQEWV
jgi:hypothetical protein